MHSNILFIYLNLRRDHITFIAPLLPFGAPSLQSCLTWTTLCPVTSRTGGAFYEWNLFAKARSNLKAQEASMAHRASRIMIGFIGESLISTWLILLQSLHIWCLWRIALLPFTLFLLIHWWFSDHLRLVWCFDCLADRRRVIYATWSILVSNYAQTSVFPSTRQLFAPTCFLAFTNVSFIV